MGERSEYPNGHFCWVDLATTDLPRAKEFYGKLMGWTFEDSPAGHGLYSMVKLGDDEVAAMYEMDEKLAKQMPTSWQSYINVKDVDATAAKWEQAGGKAMAPPFDVEGVGRMCTVVDPTGAVVHLWQAMGHFGASRVNDIGCLCWNELNTRDLAGAKKFYGEVLGWETADHGDPPYSMMLEGDRAHGGMLDMTGRVPDFIPAFWNVYFSVADTDATVKKALELGGQNPVPVMDVDVGRFAVIQDPVGAVVSVISLKETDD